jgi:hypothetical protein
MSADGNLGIDELLEKKTIARFLPKPLRLERLQSDIESAFRDTTNQYR